MAIHAGPFSFSITVRAFSTFYPIPYCHFQVPTLNLRLASLSSIPFLTLNSLPPCFTLPSLSSSDSPAPPLPHRKILLLRVGKTCLPLDLASLLATLGGQGIAPELLLKHLWMRSSKLILRNLGILSTTQVQCVSPPTLVEITNLGQTKLQQLISIIFRKASLFNHLVACWP
ncbi:unnamed protein product [Citrullus colocynthis]|uniref:Uncharacterized protein n=1 Tax=Citrullus colocynthis TaxID=252529 RepID=A0ABP0Y2V5_9ROSI